MNGLRPLQGLKRIATLPPHGERLFPCFKHVTPQSNRVNLPLCQGPPSSTPESEFDVFLIQYPLYLNNNLDIYIIPTSTNPNACFLAYVEQVQVVRQTLTNLWAL